MKSTRNNQPIDQLAANAIRIISAEGVQKANSGHPGMPMGMADCAHVLFSRFLTHNPNDTKWINRDRFILSAGHGSMLLYTMLHLTGYDVTMDELKSFRQLDSRTAGHPEFGMIPGIEATTGPLGQGFTNGVGMAIAQQILAAQFPGLPLNHHVFAIVSDGDLMEGITAEAASIAGHLKLGQIVYIYDDNSISIEGSTDLAFTEDVGKRFEAYGWQVLRVDDAHDHAKIEKALESGIQETGKPTIIIATSHIGFGSPHKVDTSDVHGSPLGPDELKATKEQLGWPLEPEFYLPDDVANLYQKRGEKLQSDYAAWQKEFDAWKEKNPDAFKTLQNMLDKKLPVDLDEQLLSIGHEKPTATRVLGGKVLNKAASIVPSIYGGSADLSPSTKTDIVGAASIEAGKFDGRNLHFGIRENAMGSILNGMALYGGFIPYGSTFLVFSDYMRPAIRLAALSHLQVAFVFTHDSIFVGEDGPTHQPIEHIASMRAIPNVDLWRPADVTETAMAWSATLNKKNGPSVLCLTRQNIPLLEKPASFKPSDILKGGYLLAKEKGNKADVVIVATGSEVYISVEAKKILEDQGKSVRVVSVPCLDLFNKQNETYKKSLIPDNVPVVVVEAGISQGWHAITRAPFLMIGMETFGVSGPYQLLAEKYGFTGPAVAEKTAQFLKSL